MDKELYREKSLERFQSPEQLDRYLRVTNPGIWTVLLAVVLLLGGLLVWGSVGVLETKVAAVAEVDSGEAQIVVTGSDAEKIGQGMKVYVSDQTAVIDHVETDEYGRAVCYAIANLSDGKYKAEIVLESIHPLSFLLR